MDVTDQLQAYISQIVALGQATLALHRRGEVLPDELAGPAEALLALESALGAPAAENADEVAAALEEPAAPAEWSPPADEAPAVEAPAEELALTPAQDAYPGIEPIAIMSPIEADDWLSSLENEPSGLLILPSPAAGGAVNDDYLVIDVDEEAGGGPAAVHSPSDALPPLVVNSLDGLAPTNVFGESDSEAGEAAASDAAAESDALPPLIVNPLDVLAPTNVFGESESEAGEAAAEGAEPAAGAVADAGVTDSGAPAADEPTPELSFCTNCGAGLRPGRLFCYRCGASVAEMVAEAFPNAVPPPVTPPTPPPSAPPPSALPPSAPPAERDEWPTFISDAPRYAAGPPPAPVPAMAGFCNNCGLGLDADVKVCPDCGSRDIS